MLPSIYAYQSSANGKLHIDVSCPGLDKVPVVRRNGARPLTPIRFRSWHQLATCATRPCRMCTLEYVLDAVLNPDTHLGRGPRSKRVFASFTSQPAYVADGRRFRANDVSDTGRDRLERIADRLGLDTCVTPVGPAAYGFLPRTGVSVLARNLRTIVRDDLSVAPSPETLSLVWTFLADTPPELAAEDDRPSDPWEAAELLTA